MADVALWSGATGAGNGTSWADAYTTLAAVIAAQGGNLTKVFVASDHMELVSAALAFPAATPYTLISVDRNSGYPPTAEQAGARIGSTNATNLTLQNSFYSRGVFWTAGENSTATRNILFDTSAGGYPHMQRIVGGGIELKNTGAGSRIIVGTSSVVRSSLLSLEDAQVRFGNAGQGVQMSNAAMRIRGGSTAGSAITEFIKSFSSGSASVDVSSLDMTSCSGFVRLLASNIAGTGRAVFDKIKTPAGWLGGLIDAPPVNTGLFAIATNVDSADTNHRMMALAGNALTRSETAIVRTGGASDGATVISWRVETANSMYPLVYPAITAELPPILKWNTTVGTPITVTVHVLTDGVALNDDDAWLEVTYLNSEFTPLGATISDERPSLLSPRAAQDASTEAWATPGITTPVKQQLSVTFTPQEAGYVRAVVRIALPATVVYVCPEPEGI